MGATVTFFSQVSGSVEKRRLVLVRADVEDGFLAGYAPAFMPGDDFVFAGRYVRQMKHPVFIGDRVVGMIHDEDDAVHPDMPRVGFQIHMVPLLRMGRVSNTLVMGNGRL